jgi:hypothetical protein
MNTKSKTGNQDLDQAVQAYMDFVKESYRKTSAMGVTHGEELVLTAEVGRKFIKIVNPRSVHSFIVINDFTTSKSAGNRSFKGGDILMAATYHQPALNKPRGNVLELDYQRITWSGTGYLV